jgi:hypothetical protein
MKEYTTTQAQPISLEDLEKETCQSFGGINCVLHQCMFECVLNKAKERATNSDKNKVKP